MKSRLQITIVTEYSLCCVAYQISWGSRKTNVSSTTFLTLKFKQRKYCAITAKILIYYAFYGRQWIYSSTAPRGKKACFYTYYIEGQFGFHFSIILWLVSTFLHVSCVQTSCRPTRFPSIFLQLKLLYCQKSY